MTQLNLWKVTRNAPDYEETETVVVVAANEQDARVAAVAAVRTYSYASQFLFSDTATAEVIGVALPEAEQWSVVLEAGRGA